MKQVQTTLSILLTLSIIFLVTSHHLQWAIPALIATIGLVLVAIKKKRTE